MIKKYGTLLLVAIAAAIWGQPVKTMYEDMGMTADQKKQAAKLRDGYHRMLGAIKNNTDLEIVCDGGQISVDVFDGASSPAA